MSLRDLDSFGRAQHGLITREQALSVTAESTVDHMVRVGELKLVHEGVYRFSGAPQTGKSQIMAAVLAAPTGAVASYESAALLHGLDVVNGAPAHVTVPAKCSRQRIGFLVHYGRLVEDERMLIAGIPTTKVERTIIDLASSIARGRLVRILDDAVVVGLTTYEKVWRSLQLAGRQGRKGVRFLRTVLEERLSLDSEGVQSKIQLKVIKAAKSLNLPKPVLECPVPAFGHVYEIDVAWPDLKIGAEADGFSVHGTSKLRFDKDRERHNHISGAGWLLLHFTARMSVDEIASQLREAWTIWRK